MRVVTHSKDMDLSQIYGDSYVEDRDGRIAVEPAGNYSVEAKNAKGDVEVTLPPNASATVEGQHAQRRHRDGLGADRQRRREQDGERQDRLRGDRRST